APDPIVLQISRADPSVGPLAASALLREWFLSEDSVASTGGAGNDKGSAWEEDTSVLAWMESKVPGMRVGVLQRAGTTPQEGVLLFYFLSSLQRFYERPTPRL
ncbi:unnamed protein product, partial [Scytosiphon promiscuus]